jgi:hypothetical protein
MNKLVASTVLGSVVSVLSQVSMAGDIGQHPAIFVSRSLPGIEASSFIVGHPAGGYAGHAEHANFEHPAVVMHRAGQISHIDPNTFIVQPPATTAWTMQAAAPVINAAISAN